MRSGCLKLWREYLAILAIAVVLATILLPPPLISRNSGSRESLSNSLREIRNKLTEKDNHAKVHSHDFSPQTMSLLLEIAPGKPKQLEDQYGVNLKWYRDGDYNEILFYPIAVSSPLRIEADPNVTPIPLLVMVPVKPEDRQTLPKLFGCDGATEEKLQKCQLQRIKRLFSFYGIHDAVLLMSDGAIEFIKVNDL